MEQRIQSLAQTLSRVGRVLWKHRERARKNLLRTTADCFNGSNSNSKLSSLHSPIAMMTEKEIIDYLWQSPRGPVQQLIGLTELGCSDFLTVPMKGELTKIVREDYKELTNYCVLPNYVTDHPTSYWRSQVKQGLLDLRSCLLTDDLYVDRNDQSITKGGEKKKKASDKIKATKDACVALADVMLFYASTTTFLKLQPYESFNSTPINVYARELGNQVLVSLVEEAKEYETPRTTILPPSSLPKRQPNSDATSKKSNPGTGLQLGEKPFITSSGGVNAEYLRKAKLGMDASSNISVPPDQTKSDAATGDNIMKAQQSGDDLLLAETLASLASSMQPNATQNENTDTSPMNVTSTASTKAPENVSTETTVGNEAQSAKSEEKKTQSKRSNRPKKKRTTFDENVQFCKPEDAVTSVVRQYEGEYVFSQLLQWFNGGIGTKRGLPNLLGCAVLPSVSQVKFSLLQASNVNGGRVKGSKDTKTYEYVKHVRPLLSDWLKDRISMSTPWDGALKDLFGTTKEEQGEIASEDIIMGSPILDWLVMGDPSNLQLLRAGLLDDHPDHRREEAPAAKIGGKRKKKTEQGKNAADRLQMHMDNNMQAPMQALSNWVQCENPTCLKWRKLPWHVDLDHDLPPKFFCKDNVWNEAANSCDHPEDDWNEEEEVMQNFQMGESIKESDLIIGARFDVYRDASKKHLSATVVETDFAANKSPTSSTKNKSCDGSQQKVSRVKFHFLHFKKESDEWIDVGSSKIAPFNSYVAATTEEKLKVAAKSSKKKNSKTQPSKKTGKRKRENKTIEKTSPKIKQTTDPETSPTKNASKKQRANNFTGKNSSKTKETTCPETSSTKKTGNPKREKGLTENAPSKTKEATCPETSPTRITESDAIMDSSNRPAKTTFATNSCLVASGTDKEITVCNNVQLPTLPAPDKISSYTTDQNTNTGVSTQPSIPFTHLSQYQLPPAFQGTTLMPSMPDFVASMPTKSMWNGTPSSMYHSSIPPLVGNSTSIFSKNNPCSNPSMPTSPIRSKIKTKAASPFKKKLLSRAKIEFTEEPNNDFQNQPGYWLPS